jgi:hypothetical protein
MRDAVLVTDAFAASEWCRATLLRLAAVALASLRQIGVTPESDLVHSAVVADGHVRSQLCVELVDESSLREMQLFTLLVVAVDPPGLSVLGWEVHAGVPSQPGQPPAQPMAESLVTSKVLAQVSPLKRANDARIDTDALITHVSRTTDALERPLVHAGAGELAQRLLDQLKL